MKMIDVVAAIIERDGKILIAQRPAHSDQAGLWEFAGGKVEADESQPQALVRELREELGIDATVGEYVASHQREVSGRIIHLHAARTGFPRYVTGTRTSGAGLVSARGSIAISAGPC